MRQAPLLQQIDASTQRSAHRSTATKEIQPYEAPLAWCAREALAEEPHVAAADITASSHWRGPSTTSSTSEISFGVNCLRDSTGLLPVKVMLGIGRQGVSMARLLSQEHVLSVGLQDIISFGYSSTTACLDVHIAGEAHALHFQTGQGQEMCRELQAQIDRRLKRRRSKQQQEVRGRHSTLASFVDSKAARLHTDTGRDWLDAAVRSPLARSRHLAANRQAPASVDTATRSDAWLDCTAHRPFASGRHHASRTEADEPAVVAAAADGSSRVWQDNTVSNSPRRNDALTHALCTVDALTFTEEASAPGLDRSWPGHALGSPLPRSRLFSHRRPVERQAVAVAARRDFLEVEGFRSDSGCAGGELGSRAAECSSSDGDGSSGGGVPTDVFPGFSNGMSAGAVRQAANAEESRAVADTTGGSSDINCDVMDADQETTPPCRRHTVASGHSRHTRSPSIPAARRALQDVTHLCQPAPSQPHTSSSMKAKAVVKATDAELAATQHAISPASPPQALSGMAAAAAFAVNRVQDPTGWLPVKVLLMIDDKGVHFSSLVPAEHIFTTRLRDVVQYGSSSATVCLDLRTSPAGATHALHFQTGQGEEICAELQRHIDRRLKCRRSKQQSQEVS